MPTLREALDEVNTWDKMSPGQLEELRRSYIEKARSLGGADKLPDEDLHAWLAVTRQLRKGKAGPPAKPKREKGAPITSSDLF